jgi:HPt (histidine-containing phosphotransfer) domain-containing protein
MDEYLPKPLRLQTVSALIDQLPELGADPVTPVSAAGPCFDPAPLSDIDEPDTEATLIAMFLDQAVERLPELETAIEQGDADSLRKLAHGLKGSSATLGACRMTELCDALCKLPADRVTAQAKQIHLELREALVQTGAAMNLYIGKKAA